MFTLQCCMIDVLISYEIIRNEVMAVWCTWCMMRLSNTENERRAFFRWFQEQKLQNCALFDLNFAGRKFEGNFGQNQDKKRKFQFGKVEALAMSLFEGIKERSFICICLALFWIIEPLYRTFLSILPEKTKEYKYSSLRYRYGSRRNQWKQRRKQWIAVEGKSS